VIAKASGWLFTDQDNNTSVAGTGIGLVNVVEGIPDVLNSTLNSVLFTVPSTNPNGNRYTMSMLRQFLTPLSYEYFGAKHHVLP
jgi:hypothetical protein